MSSTRDVGATLERAAELQAIATAYCRIAQLDESLVRKTVFGYAPLARGRTWQFWPNHARRQDGSPAHECLIDHRIGGNGRTADDVKRDWFAALARLDAYERGLSSGGPKPEATGLGATLQRLGIAMTPTGKTSTVEGGWFDQSIAGASERDALPGLIELPEPPPKKTRAKPVRLSCGKCGWVERVSQRHMQHITGHLCRKCGVSVANDAEQGVNEVAANGCDAVPELRNQPNVSESCTECTDITLEPDPPRTRRWRTPEEISMADDFEAAKHSMRQSVRSTRAWEVYEYLIDNHATTIPVLAEQTGLRRSQVRQALKDLQWSNMIQRTPSGRWEPLGLDRDHADQPEQWFGSHDIRLWARREK